jgi:aldehyde dehydrogenase (NAD+)
VEIKKIVENQREFFNNNKTKSISFRKAMLKKMLFAIQQNEDEICNAIYQDLGKSKAEAYMTEIGIVYAELKEAIKNLDKWSRPQKVRGTISTFPAKNYIYSEPYGITLILAPWNYPFNLSMAPLVGAIAAGNCVIMKCSRSSINTSKIIQRILNGIFTKEYIFCVDAQIEYDEVLKQKYDYIFFTGSPNVGKIIMRAASENLTPVSLELGGKSPCIVERSANMRLAAKRIVWGKFLNSGQTCISIDYIVVEDTVKDIFVKYLLEEIQNRYAVAENKDDYPNIINAHHYERLCKRIDKEKVVIGGGRNPEKRKIAPTILPEADFDHEIMEEEIFGPILPVISYHRLDDIIKKIKDMSKPLACYIFTEDKHIANKLISEISYGGGCINDVVIQFANHHMPFGGVGNSGMGSYHGKFSFDTFSHKKSVVKNKTYIDIPVRYAPYDEKKLKILKRLF